MALGPARFEVDGTAIAHRALGAQDADDRPAACNEGDSDKCQ